MPSKKESKFSRCEFDTELVRRALTDPGFRKRLVEDPKGVYSSELGRDIPEEVVVRVLEESGNLVYLVIPHSPKGLSEVEAEDLATRRKTHREPCWNLGDGLE